MTVCLFSKWLFEHANTVFISALTLILSLHPFMEGNSRLSRLLWNYSLTCNGLPFPVILFSGITRKPYKVYITCLTKTEKEKRSRMLHLAHLLVVPCWRDPCPCLVWVPGQGFATPVRVKPFATKISVKRWVGA